MSAPFGGEVVEVNVAAKTQVDAAAPMFRIRERELDGDAVAVDAELDFAALEPDDEFARPSLTALHGYLLGFDRDPDSVAAAVARLARQPGGRGRGRGSAAGAVRRRQRAAPHAAGRRPASPPPSAEYLLSYLQWLDADQAGPSGPVPRRAEQDAGPLRRDRARANPAARSGRRLDVAIVPSRRRVWLRRSRACSSVGCGAASPRHPSPTPRCATLLERLAVATRGRYPDIADLARDLLFHYVDEPLIERVVAAAYAEMAADLDALAADPAAPDRAARIARLVACPQPMRGPLLRRWATADAPFREALLEIHLRRYYRIYELHDLVLEQRHGCQLVGADYADADEAGHLVVGYVPDAGPPAALHAVAEHLSDACPPGRMSSSTWSPGDAVDRLAADALADDYPGAAERRRLRPSGAPGRHHRHQRRFASRNTTAPSTSPSGPAARAEFVEDAAYRNLHPMLAKRMDLWRLANFELERLRSVEDVYLFRGVAHDNPADVRLFALAEVRDLTPAYDEDGRVVALPLLERMGLQALAAMRQAHGERPAEAASAGQPAGALRATAVHAADETSGGDSPRATERWPRPRICTRSCCGCRFRAAANSSTRVIEFAAADSGFTVRTRPPADQPIRSLTAYRQKVLRARRHGAHVSVRDRPHARAPGDGVATNFPPGEFVEYDLDEGGELVPVDRPYGENAANLVVGVLTSYPAEIPEGMSRVAILGDPIRRLGALAEPECRRVIAALDLAERLRCPGRVVRAVLGRADRDGQRHREHGLDRRGAAPDHRVHPGRRRDQRRRHRDQRRRPAVLERGSHDAHAHQGHPGDDRRRARWC